jgi:hypothetical protein
MVSCPMCRQCSSRALAECVSTWRCRRPSPRWGCLRRGGSTLERTTLRWHPACSSSSPWSCTFGARLFALPPTPVFFVFASLSFAAQFASRARRLLAGLSRVRPPPCSIACLFVTQSIVRRGSAVAACMRRRWTLGVVSALPSQILVAVVEFLLTRV